MSIDKLRSVISAALLAALLSLISGSAVASGDPIRVRHSISIRNGNWIPLPVEDMRRAAGDAALSRLSDAGRLYLLDRNGSGADAEESGSLSLEIALIGPAETAKLTITLDVKGSPTLVSTASISVRALDHAGIYAALEHVGERAADRLAAKLDLLRDGRFARNGGLDTQHDDPERRRTYDGAQAAKRAGRYNEARLSFEAIVESGAGMNDALRQLAEDELRYGLPLFEAQQALNDLGRLSLPGQRGRREEALSRAENLFRQIQAENPSSVQRTTEAQRSLDQLIVVRGALANAMRASVLSRLHSLRIGMMEFSMMEGNCPGEDQVADLAARMNARVVLDEIVLEGDRAKRYKFSDPDSRTRVELRCSDAGIEIVESIESTSGSSPFPASTR
jgi:hypothetical protein